MNRTGWGFLIGRWRGRRDGPVFGAQVSGQLSNFIVGDRVAERGHLLAAVENLIGDFGRGPELVLAQVCQSRSLLSTDAADAVAVGTALVAKQSCAGLLGGPGLAAGESMGWVCGEEGEGQQKDRGNRQHASNHGDDSLMARLAAPHPLGGCNWSSTALQVAEVVIELFRLRCPDCGVKAEKVPQLPGKAPFSNRFEEAVGLARESAAARCAAIWSFGQHGSGHRSSLSGAMGPDRMQAGLAAERSHGFIALRPARIRGNGPGSFRWFASTPTRLASG